MRGELRAVVARTEQPDRRQRDVVPAWRARCGTDGFREAVVLEQHQLLEASQEIVVVAGVLPSPQRVGGDRVGAGRAPEAEIDASGKQRLEHLEALGDHQRRVVRQHDAARADAHVLGNRGDLADHDVGRGAGDRRQVVVLGDPVAREAEPVGEAGEVERVAQRGAPEEPAATGERSRTESGTTSPAARIRTATDGARANLSSSRSGGLCGTAARCANRSGRSPASPADPSAR